MLTRTREWIFNMPERNSTFKQGADFYAKEMGAFVGRETSRITNGDYLASIQKEIRKNLISWGLLTLQQHGAMIIA